MAEQEFTTEEIEHEQWLPVVGAEGWYSVSNLGRVRREKSGKGTYIGRILIPHPDTYGYPSVGLSIDAVPYRANIHLLVSRAFLGPKPVGQEVNHKDANKWNNRLPNLEYQTHRGNMEHASKNKLFHHAQGDKNGARLHPERLKRGTNHHAYLRPEIYKNHSVTCRKRLTEKQIREIRRLGDNRLLPRWQIQEQFSVSLTTIKKILSRKSHKRLL